MGVARITGAFYGTSEVSLGASIANFGFAGGAEVDVLGDDASQAWIKIFAVITSTSNTGTVDFRINSRRVSGVAYTTANPQHAVTPNSATLRVMLGMYKASRYMSVDIQNNGLGSACTVFVGYEGFQER